jgi:hypothetical protein
MRFRFSIRDLLWLTLVVGLIVGWWLDHQRHVLPEFHFSTRPLVNGSFRD